jgi:hypothetical protein
MNSSLKENEKKNKNTDWKEDECNLIFRHKLKEHFKVWF